MSTQTLKTSSFFRNAFAATAVAGLVAGLWAATPSVGQEPVRKRGLAAPEVDGVSEWVNSEPVKMGDLKGRVVVVHFYAFDCINCIRNLPHYNAWQKEFGDKPFTILGFQTPETDEEKKFERVKEKAKQAEMTYRIGFDADAKMWTAWGNDLWPTVYLIDKKGEVRYRWRGELEWEGAGGAAKMRAKIQELLAEPYKAEKPKSEERERSSER